MSGCRSRYDESVCCNKAIRPCGSAGTGTMAGTRLVAHSGFLIFSLITVLVAWRLGVVTRAPLPLKEMANLGGTPSVAMPVDVDLVILRKAGMSGRPGADCPSCAAVLDAVQFDPSLARDAFVSAQEAEEKTDRWRERDSTVDENSLVENIHPRLFSLRNVDVRVIHAASGREPPPPPSEPEALDEWLLKLTHVQSRSAFTAHGAKPSLSGTTDETLSSPRYTFFVGCAGTGDSGELPIFTIGKHRHGYLGLGCGCACDDDTDESMDRNRDASNVDVFSADGHGGLRPAGGGPTAGGVNEPTSTSATHVVRPGENTGGKVSPSVRVVASATALAALQTLAGVAVAHVLRSPVSAGDVHVRLGQAYRLNFSLMSEDPGARRCTWDFASASRRFLRPMLKKLRPVASFAVQSQEVQYARLSSAPPRKHSAKRRWYYSPQDLKGFLGANDFSILDLDAGWGAVDGYDSGDAVSSDNSTAAHSTVSSPHSQVPVNFMVFCPSPTHSPLVFMEEWAGADGSKKPVAEAYEVPGFGGVSVINGFLGGAGDPLDVVDSERIRRAFGAHASQLRRIIGLPRPSDRPFEVSWSEISNSEKGDDGRRSEGQENMLCGSCPAAHNPTPTTLPLTFLPSPKDGVTDWEVDALIRTGLLRSRRAAADTLKSLAALVESSPEMEISAKIAEDVAVAISALATADTVIFKENVGRSSPDQTQFTATSDRERYPRRFQRACDVGSDPACGEDAGRRALYWAREALRRSESAYFDPTMVPQLYFPQDHLMAVYLPFLGPLAFPLLWGFAQELWRYYKKRKARKHKLKKEGNREGGNGRVEQDNVR